MTEETAVGGEDADGSGAVKEAGGFKMEAAGCEEDGEEETSEKTMVGGV